MVPLCMHDSLTRIEDACICLVKVPRIAGGAVLESYGWLGRLTDYTWVVMRNRVGGANAD